MGASRGEPPDNDNPKEPSDSNTSKEVTQLFRALANKYRRAVIRALDETHTPATQTALATYVTKEVLPESERDNFLRFRRRMVASLHHVHLPLLEQAGIIEMKAGQILLGSNFPQAVALIEETA